METKYREARPWVGGGTIAAVCEVSPYQTKLEAYLEFIGLAPEHTPEKLRFFRNRKRSEPFIFATLTEEYGLNIVATNQRYQDEQFTWAKAELDAELSDGRRIEAKSGDPRASKRWGKMENDDSIPLDIICQVQWGFGVRPGDEALVVAQIGWDDTRLLPLHPDREVIAMTRARALEFMTNHVIPRIPPAPASIEDALLLFPKSIADACIATPEVEAALLEMVKLDQQAEALEVKKERCSTLVRSFMKDKDTLLKHQAGTIATYRSNKDSVKLDADQLLIAYEKKLGDVMMDAAAWCAAQRRQFTSPKPGARPLRNLLKKA